MFFGLSKIIGAVLSPLNLTFLLFAGALLLTVFSRKAARSFFLLGFLLMILCGVLPLGSNLLVQLENSTHRPEQMPERIDGILILGGSFDTALSETRQAIALNETAERIVDALALARQYPQAVIVYSGGNGRLTGRIGTEAQAMAGLLDTLTIPDDNFIYEDESRNTYENIVFSKDLVLPQEGEHWLLVTSAFHMKRALAVARTAGWDMIPYPVDYRTRGEMKWLPTGLNLGGNYYDAHVALHEYLGLLAYQLTGKISLPLP
ncbi:MAG: YdcF family protein [Rhodospirillales bacterium]|nr:YdcF family protein [Rhodospirillales bacterium]